jgi:membrane associated rhomboid family serine protease
VHLLGNLVFGALFAALACEMLGTGLGLAAILSSGALANLANAWVQAPEFRSVGASTAVFGALGLLGGHRWQRRKLVRGLRRASWIPLLASAFLLAYLGSGGTRTDGAERVDVLGHALGFVAGGALGALHGRFAHAWRPDARAQVAFGAASFALIVGCWWLALR